MAQQFGLLGRIHQVTVVTGAGQELGGIFERTVVQTAAHLNGPIDKLGVVARLHFSGLDCLLALGENGSGLQETGVTRASTATKLRLLGHRLRVAIIFRADLTPLRGLGADLALHGFVGHAAAVKVVAVLVRVAFVLEVEVLAGALVALEHLLAVGAAKLVGSALVAGDAVRRNEYAIAFDRRALDAVCSRAVRGLRVDVRRTATARLSVG